MIFLVVLSLVLATAAAATITPLTVDLGYASYTGVHNASTRLSAWKGIRYAQLPVGRLRWQAPQPLTNVSTNTLTNASTPILADKFGPACPQSLPQVPGASSLFIPGNEDCLFLNVYAPSSNTGAPLPVLVWIHGGGYGEGDATQDLSQLLAATSYSHPIIGVSIQYRLGAFGFLASREVEKRGKLNAGLLDQKAALQWVHRHIGSFGGDPGRVTLAGESAGAGSVVLHAVSHEAGDSEPHQLFHQIWTASPWIPTQPRYDSDAVERHYADFVVAAGCNTSVDTFACLLSKDTLVLQWASTWVSTNKPTPHGNWAFVPVTDDAYIKGPPSRLLTKEVVHGVNALVGNNADEGVLLVPASIRTEADLRAWLREYFHELDEDDIDRILTRYPPTNTTLPATGYETDGIHPPTANDVSSAAVGVQQRAYVSVLTLFKQPPPTDRQNIYAEASVVCPSYWLSTAFSNSSGNLTRTAYHYQYSVPFAAHGADLTAYWGPPTPNQGPDFVQAFRGE